MHVDEAIIHDLERYRTEGYPWAEWDLFRDEAPVYWYQRCLLYTSPSPRDS